MEVLRIDTGVTSFHSIEILLDVEGIIAGFVKPRNNVDLDHFQPQSRPIIVHGEDENTNQVERFSISADGIPVDIRLDF